MKHKIMMMCLVVETREPSFRWWRTSLVEFFSHCQNSSWRTSTQLFIKWKSPSLLLPPQNHLSSSPTRLGCCSLGAHNCTPNLFAHDVAAIGRPQQARAGLRRQCFSHLVQDSEAFSLVALCCCHHATRHCFRTLPGPLSIRRGWRLSLSDGFAALWTGCPPSPQSSDHSVSSAERPPVRSRVQQHTRMLISIQNGPNSDVCLAMS